MKQLLLTPAIFFLSFYNICFATTHTWTGSASTNWATSTNWSPNGVPSSSDSVIIVSGSNAVHLSSNVSIASFTINSGSVNLETYSINISAGAFFNSGALTNGSINLNSIDTLVCSSTTFNCNLTITYLTQSDASVSTVIEMSTGNNLTLHNCTFAGYFEVDGYPNISMPDYCEFDGQMYAYPNNFYITDTAVFNSNCFIYGQNGNIIITGNAQFNAYAEIDDDSGFIDITGIATFNDQAYISNVNNEIYISGAAAFYNTIYLYNPNSNIIISGTGIFNDYVNIQATNLTFSGTETFNSGVAMDAIINNGGVVLLHGITQTDPTQYFDLNMNYGDSLAIYDPFISGLFEVDGYPSIYMYGGEYGGETYITSKDISIVPDGSDTLFFDNQFLLYVQDGYSATVSTGTIVFNAPVYIYGQNGDVTLGDSSSGSVILGNSANIYVEIDSSGILHLANFSQNDSTQYADFYTYGTSEVDIESGCVFYGEVEVYSPDIFLDGGIFYNQSIFEQTGNGYNVYSYGGNSFYAPAYFYNDSANNFYLANNASDNYYNDAFFGQYGSGFIDASYSSNAYLGGLLTFDGDTTFQFGTSGGTTVFNGTSDQTIYNSSSGTLAISKVEVNKNTNSVILATPLTISDSLSLKKGVVITDTINLLTLSDNSIATGGADTAYIAGPIQKIGNDAFTFPLGDTSLHSGAYHPLGISAPSSTTDAFMAQYFAQGQTFGADTDSTIENISTCEYWTLKHSAGSSSVSVTLGWNTNSCNVFRLPSMKVGYWNGSRWKDEGSGTFTGHKSAGTVKTSTAVSSFGPFVVANSTSSTCSSSAQLCNNMINNPSFESVNTIPTQPGGLTDGFVDCWLSQPTTSCTFNGNANVDLFDAFAPSCTTAPACSSSSNCVWVPNNYVSNGIPANTGNCYIGMPNGSDIYVQLNTPLQPQTDYYFSFYARASTCLLGNSNVTGWSYWAGFGWSQSPANYYLPSNCNATNSTFPSSWTKYSACINLSCWSATFLSNYYLDHFYFQMNIFGSTSTKDIILLDDFSLVPMADAGPAKNYSSSCNCVTIGPPTSCVNSDITYTWAPPTGLSCTNCANPCANPTTTTTYTLTASLSNPSPCNTCNPYYTYCSGGCTSTDEVTVTVVTPPTVSIVSHTDATCHGVCNGSAIASVSGGCGAPYSYQWSCNGSNVSSSSNLCAGTCTVTVTDNCGCTATASVTITQPPALSISATSTPTCAGSCTGTASATASGGTPPYSYSWSPLGFSSSITNLCACTYTVRVTDANGCTATTTVTISAVEVGISGNTIVCSTTSPYTYTITNYNPLVTYSITVIDANGTFTGVAYNAGSGTFTWTWPQVITGNFVQNPGGEIIVSIPTLGCTDTLFVQHCCYDLGNYPSTLSLSGNISGVFNLLIADVITINGNVTFQPGSTLTMEPGSKIDVLPGSNFSLDNTIIQAGPDSCKAMWQGIKVHSSGTTITAVNVLGSQIYDAENAIDVLNDNVFIEIGNTSLFERNYNCIKISDHNQPTFTNVVTFILDPIFNGTALISPYNGQKEWATYSNAGLVAFNTKNLNIGTAGPPAIFNHLNYGIYAINCNGTTVKYSTFTNMNRYNTSTNPAEGSGIYCNVEDIPVGGMCLPISTFGRSALNVLGNGLSSGVSFKNCIYGIYAVKTTDFVFETYMNNVNTGIELRNNNKLFNGFSTLSYNLINAVSTANHPARGIECQYNAQAGVSMDYNKINVNSSYVSPIYGINVLDGNIPYYLVDFNQISMIGNAGIFNGNDAGVCFSDINGSSILNNTVRLNSLFEDGIATYYSDKNNINCNDVRQVPCNILFTNATDNRSSTGNTFRCNYFDRTLNASFFYNSNTPMHYLGNHINNHINGVWVQPPVSNIGPQGNPTYCNGNLWLNLSYSPNPSSLCPALPGLGLNSSIIDRFYHPNYSTCAIGPPYYESNGALFVFYLSCPGTIYACGGSCSIPNIMVPNDTMLTAEDTLIAADSLHYSTDRASQYKWSTKKSLYQKLKDYPNLLQDSLFIHFYDSIQTTSIAYFTAVEDSMLQLYSADAQSHITIADNDSVIMLCLDSIHVNDSLIKITSDTTTLDSLRRLNELIAAHLNSLDSTNNIIFNTAAQGDSSRITMIRGMNEGVTVSATHEQNLQKVNDIYLNTIASGVWSFDSTQRSNLHDIAIQCPETGGAAVYMARSMYSLITDTMSYNDLVLCSDSVDTCHVTNPPGPISGAILNECGKSNQVYSISPVTGASSYTWWVSDTTYSHISGATDLDSVIINFDSGLDSVTLFVSANNSCGGSAPQTVVIKGPPTMPPLPNIVIVCKGDTSQYSFSFPSGGITQVTGAVTGAVYERTDTLHYSISASVSGSPGSKDTTSDNIHLSSLLTDTMASVQVIWGAGSSDTLKIKLGNSCGSDSGVILVHVKAPQGYAGIDQTICHTGTATMSGKFFNGATYAEWGTTGDGSFDSTYSMTPIYTPGSSDKSGGSVHLILNPDAAGCTAIPDTMLLIIRSAISISLANNTPICSGSTVNISSSVSSGTSPYTYSWTGPASYSSTSADPSIGSSSGSNSGTYSLTVTDANGCSSTATTSVTVITDSTTLNLKLFIEGYYLGSSAQEPAMYNEGVSGSTSSQTDTIIVELHNTTSPYSVAESAKTILYSDGTATATFSCPTADHSYYIAIRHRNAIQTWSHDTVSFTITTSYDFTTAASKAYGNNMIEVDTLGVWAFYNGDINQDENIDLLDWGIYSADATAGDYGYYASDLNGDGNVDLLDFPVLDTNMDDGIYSNHP